MTEKRTLFFKLACLGCLLLTVACTGRDQYDQPISGELPASIIPYYAGAVGAPQYEDLLKSSKQNVSVRVGMLLPLSIGMNPYLLLFVFTDNKMCWLRGLDVMACYLSLWGSEKASYTMRDISAVRAALALSSRPESAINTVMM